MFENMFCPFPVKSLLSRVGWLDEMKIRLTQFNCCCNCLLDVEQCLGIFSTIKPRSDKLPSLFLHWSECWDRSGHFCPDLTRPRDSEIDTDVLVDFDHYDPTLHVPVDKMVRGNLNSKGCTVDWTILEKTLLAW